MKTNRIRGKQDMAEVLRILRRAQRKTLRQVVEENKEIFTDTAHLSKIEWGKWGLRDLDKLSELLEYYGYSLVVVKT